MSMNRRNVLVGLGTIVAGGGAALGTGAFSSVTADRTVTVETAGDADAFLGLQIRDDLAADENTIDLNFENAGNGAEGINENAKTTLDKVLLIQNNGTQENIGITFEVEIDDTTDASNVFSFNENNEGDFDDGDGGIDPNGEPLNPNQSAAYDLEINLREDEVDVPDALDSDDSFEVTVTITAEEDSE
ncbi:hypothetical protein [Natronorubrum bangense]|nr:hypothetical protein [Natronorubrum bangense]